MKSNANSMNAVNTFCCFHFRTLGWGRSDQSVGRPNSTFYRLTFLFFMNIRSFVYIFKTMPPAFSQIIIFHVLHVKLLCVNHKFTALNSYYVVFFPRRTLFVNSSLKQHYCPLILQAQDRISMLRARRK